MNLLQSQLNFAKITKILCLHYRVPNIPQNLLIISQKDKFVLTLQNDQFVDVQQWQKFFFWFAKNGWQKNSREISKVA